MMVWENLKVINFDNVEEHFVKVYKISNYRSSEEDIKDNDLESDDSNMKIFSFSRD